MPLPTESQTPWPPKAVVKLQRDIDEASAWYSGDSTALSKFYAPAGVQPSGWQRFWARHRTDDAGRDRQRLHVPAAADVAATSADLLFGEAPTLTVAEADEKRAQDRLEELSELNGLPSVLLEGAELCAALGGIYLRPFWDPALADHPILTTVHADRAVPEFRFGQLVAVTFWRTVLEEPGGQVWRHLERHEPGVVLHGLYAGNAQTLGVQRKLGDHPDTAALAVDDDGVVRAPGGITGLLVRYVPNALPNRRHRGMPVGRADTAGTETLMDALDETWTSWMRDIRLGKMRILVEQEYLSRAGRGSGASFDADQEVFTPLNIGPSADSSRAASMTPVEFKLRVEEHQQTVAALFEQIARTAGYSPQSFGMQGDGGDQTATEVDARESRSERTTNRKQRYWRRPVEDVAEMLLVIDREVFSSGVEPVRPRLDYGETEHDPRRIAETIELLRRAGAVSIDTRVRMAQPHLGDEEVALEVERIRAEEGLTVADPTGGLP